MKNKTPGNDDEPSVEKQIGWRLRQRRIEIGLSAEDLDDRLGATKGTTTAYEEGRRFIGSSDLFALSEAVKVEVSYFFLDSGESLREKTGGGPAPDTVVNASRLIQEYYKIQDHRVRRKLVDLLKDIADDEDAGKPRT